MEAEPKEILANIKEPNEEIKPASVTTDMVDISIENNENESLLIEIINIKGIITSFLLNITEVTELSDTFNKYVNFELDVETKKLLFKVLDEYGDFFTEIEETFLKITHDNKIDTKDIPDILELLKKLYEFIYNQKDKKINIDKSVDICGFLIKFTIVLLIEKNKIHISDDKKEKFLEEIEKLIDSCLALIKLTSLLKPKNCKKWFTELF